ncbi:hypothetical protein RS9916_30584 [Synechococcus sp. RS9916]|nr:hypothetical protein RS9916_30584 [Synechococcus sp. RS9916]
MNFDEFSKFEMSSRLWQGVASLYVFCLIIAVFGLIGLLDGDIILGLIIIASSAGGALIIHKIVKRYLKGRNY